MSRNRRSEGEGLFDKVKLREDVREVPIMRMDGW